VSRESFQARKAHHIHQADTAIEHFHSPLFQYRTVSKQEALILEHIQKGKTYTISELAYLTKLDKSAVSARRNHMLKTGILVMGKRRKCLFTEIYVQTVRLAEGV
jgi:predicted transcriptional regulator